MRFIRIRRGAYGNIVQDKFDDANARRRRRNRALLWRFDDNRRES